MKAKYGEQLFEDVEDMNARGVRLPKIADYVEYQIAATPVRDRGLELDR